MPRFLVFVLLLAVTQTLAQSSPSRSRLPSRSPRSTPSPRASRSPRPSPSGSRSRSPVTASPSTSRSPRPSRSPRASPSPRPSPSPLPRCTVEADGWSIRSGYCVLSSDDCSRMSVQGGELVISNGARVVVERCDLGVGVSISVATKAWLQVVDSKVGPISCNRCTLVDLVRSYVWLPLLSVLPAVSITDPVCGMLDRLTALQAVDSYVAYETEPLEPPVSPELGVLPEPVSSPEPLEGASLLLTHTLAFPVPGNCAIWFVNTFAGELAVELHNGPVRFAGRRNQLLSLAMSGCSGPVSVLPLASVGGLSVSSHTGPLVLRECTVGSVSLSSHTGAFTVERADIATGVTISAHQNGSIVLSQSAIGGIGAEGALSPLSEPIANLNITGCSVSGGATFKSLLNLVVVSNTLGGGVSVTGSERVTFTSNALSTAIDPAIGISVFVATSTHLLANYNADGMALIVDNVEDTVLMNNTWSSVTAVGATGKLTYGGNIVPAVKISSFPAVVLVLPRSESETFECDSSIFPTAVSGTEGAVVITSTAPDVDVKAGACGLPWASFPGLPGVGLAPTPPPMPPTPSDVLLLPPCSIINNEIPDSATAHCRLDVGRCESQTSTLTISRRVTTANGCQLTVPVILTSNGWLRLSWATVSSVLCSSCRALDLDNTNSGGIEMVSATSEAFGGALTALRVVQSRIDPAASVLVSSSLGRVIIQGSSLGSFMVSSHAPAGTLAQQNVVIEFSTLTSASVQSSPNMNVVITNSQLDSNGPYSEVRLLRMLNNKYSGGVSTTEATKMNSVEASNNFAPGVELKLVEVGSAIVANNVYGMFLAATLPGSLTFQGNTIDFVSISTAASVRLLTPPSYTKHLECSADVGMAATSESGAVQVDTAEPGAAMIAGPCAAFASFSSGVAAGIPLSTASENQNANAVEKASNPVMWVGVGLAAMVPVMFLAVLSTWWAARKRSSVDVEELQNPFEISSCEISFPCPSEMEASMEGEFHPQPSASPVDPNEGSLQQCRV